MRQTPLSANNQYKELLQSRTYAANGGTGALLLPVILQSRTYAVNENQVLFGIAKFLQSRTYAANLIVS